MSSYLHNLVLRSFGLVETAQPRVASLFEPQPAWMPLDAQANLRPVPELDRVADADENPAHVPSADARSIASRKAPPALSHLPPTDAAPSLPHIEHEPSPHIAPHQPRGKLFDSAPLKANELPEAQSDSTDASRVEPQTARVRDEAIARPLLQRETHASVQPAPLSSSGMTDAQNVARAPSPAETIRVPEQVATKSLVQTIESAAHALSTQQQPRAETNLPPEKRAHAQHEAPPTIVKEVSVQRVVERSPLTERSQLPALLQDEPSTISDDARGRRAPLLVRPRVSHYRDEKSLADDSQQARAAEPEQVVHVTIGRIEVRAVSPQPQAKTTRSKPQPAQSLEEYLRQRAQGGGSR